MGSLWLHLPSTCSLHRVGSLHRVSTHKIVAGLSDQIRFGLRLEPILPYGVVFLVLFEPFWDNWLENVHLQVLGDALARERLQMAELRRCLVTENLDFLLWMLVLGLLLPAEVGPVFLIVFWGHVLVLLLGNIVEFVNFVYLINLVILISIVFMAFHRMDRLHLITPRPR